MYIQKKNMKNMKTYLGHELYNCFVLLNWFCFYFIRVRWILHHNHVVSVYMPLSCLAKMTEEIVWSGNICGFSFMALHSTNENIQTVTKVVLGLLFFYNGNGNLVICSMWEFLLSVNIVQKTYNFLWKWYLFWLSLHTGTANSYIYIFFQF